jgi:hypothetical protein
VLKTGLDYIYQQLRIRKIADTRIIVSINTQYSTAELLDIIQTIQANSHTTITKFHCELERLKQSISLYPTPTDTAALYIKQQNTGTTLVFVFTHEQHDGLRILQQICKSLAINVRNPTLTNIRQNYAFATTRALLNLWRLQRHQHLFSTSRHSAIHCELDTSDLNKLKRKHQLSLADAILLHIILCLRDSLVTKPKRLSIGKLLATRGAAQNNFTIATASIKLQHKNISRQLTNKFNLAASFGLTKLFNLSAKLPFSCTQKIINIISQKLDIMFSFFPIITSSAQRDYELQISTPDNTNAVFVFAVKHHGKISLSITINSEKIIHSKFNSLLCKSTEID